MRSFPPLTYFLSILFFRMSARGFFFTLSRNGLVFFLLSLGMVRGGLSCSHSLGPVWRFCVYGVLRLDTIPPSLSLGVFIADRVYPQASLSHNSPSPLSIQTVNRIQFKYQIHCTFNPPMTFQTQHRNSPRSFNGSGGHGRDISRLKLVPFVRPFRSICCRCGRIGRGAVSRCSNFVLEVWIAVGMLAGVVRVGVDGVGELRRLKSSGGSLVVLCLDSSIRWRFT